MLSSITPKAPESATDKAAAFRLACESSLKKTMDFRYVLALGELSGGWVYKKLPTHDALAQDKQRAIVSDYLTTNGFAHRRNKRDWITQHLSAILNEVSGYECQCLLPTSKEERIKATNAMLLEWVKPKDKDTDTDTDTTPLTHGYVVDVVVSRYHNQSVRSLTKTPRKRTGKTPR
jgi:hypothetical protein